MFAARLVPLAETAGTALAIFALASELLGPGAGALGGLLWLSSPLVLGIGHLDGTDVPFALAVVLAAWALARWLRRRSRRALAWVGVALAGAALSEATGFLVAAAALAVVAIATLRESPAPRARVTAALRRTGLATLIALAGVWLGYAALDPALLGHPGLLPAPYLAGIRYLRAADTVPAPGYLAGVSYTGGQWWFWPLSLVIKLPAAALALLVAGAAGLLAVPPDARRRTVAAVGLPALLLTAFTVAMPRDIGVRYLLPVLALWAAAAGALVPAAAALRPAIRRPVADRAGVLLAAAALATGTSFPDSLSWTAPGFRPGYANATDSNVDWGQGLYALTSWAAGRRAWVAYFGPRGLAPDPVPGSRPLLGVPPERVTGWVAVSATALTSADRDRLAWLRGYCPVRVLDGSVLVYRFRRPPVPARPPGARRRRARGSGVTSPRRRAEPADRGSGAASGRISRRRCQRPVAWSPPGEPRWRFPRRVPGPSRARWPPRRRPPRRPRGRGPSARTARCRRRAAATGAPGRPGPERRPARPAP